MKKDFLVIGGLFIVIIVLLFVGNALNVFLKDLTPQSVSTTQVGINNLIVTADVAKTTRARSKGLSQKESLPSNSGMLFVFDKVDRHSFWMKDMKFPIDIIWIDKEKRIADITHNAQPEIGTPEALLRLYQPAEPVLYVLEVAAGTASNYNLKIGNKVEFAI